MRAATPVHLLLSSSLAAWMVGVRASAGEQAEGENRKVDMKVDMSQLAAVTDFSNPQQSKVLELFGAFVSKTQLLEVENNALKRRVSSLEAASSTMATDTGLLKADVQSIAVRLDECEVQIPALVQDLSLIHI